uniref:Uncharacterized protein n=1 Tax=Anguilla anguilla TaxID=7936 RepID=A0A0E9U8D7_ANGAN
MRDRNEQRWNPVLKGVFQCVHFQSQADLVGLFSIL